MGRYRAGRDIIQVKVLRIESVKKGLQLNYQQRFYILTTFLKHSFFVFTTLHSDGAAMVLAVQKVEQVCDNMATISR